MKEKIKVIFGAIVVLLYVVGNILLFVSMIPFFVVRFAIAIVYLPFGLISWVLMTSNIKKFKFRLIIDWLIFEPIEHIKQTLENTFLRS